MRPTQHQCLPPEVVELIATEHLLAAQLAQTKQLLALRTALKVVRLPYVPVADLEATADATEQQLVVVKQRAKGLLRDACDGCPNRRECPARMQ